MTAHKLHRISQQQKKQRTRFYDFLIKFCYFRARFCDSRKISQNLGAESITAVLEFFP
ncbi:hypothetical protein [Helicobacter sp. 23-1045]